jgi:hypothetical protein
VKHLRGARAQAGEGDGALEKIAKFFPVETGGPYLALSTLLIQSTDADTTARTGWLLAIFFVLLALTLVLLLRLYPKATYQQRWMPVLIGTGAFVIWAYAAGGLAVELGVYNGAAALMLPGLFGVVAAAFTPRLRKPTVHMVEGT